MQSSPTRPPNDFTFPNPMLIRHLATLAAVALLAAGCTTPSNTNPGPGAANNRDVNRPADANTTARNTGAASGQTVNNATNRTN